MRPIAHIVSPLQSKFGIPRQSGLVPELRATVVFEPPFRNPDALRGLDGFSHLWLLWDFSESPHDPERWSPTVRPPRLGGNVRLGVFATRSPFRPNPVGLSCVRLLSVDRDTPDGPVLRVGGADLLDGTPVYDIKPYLPYADAVPDAAAGFAPAPPPPSLKVEAPPELLSRIPDADRPALLRILELDPRPAYQRAPKDGSRPDTSLPEADQDSPRVYAFSYSGHTVRFAVDGSVLRVLGVEPMRGP